MFCQTWNGKTCRSKRYRGATLDHHNEIDRQNAMIKSSRVVSFAVPFLLDHHVLQFFVRNATTIVVKNLFLACVGEQQSRTPVLNLDMLRSNCVGNATSIVVKNLFLTCAGEQHLTIITKIDRQHVMIKQKSRGNA